jgi:pimeloyl-ACP methyl ester carboxylesterase
MRTLDPGPGLREAHVRLPDGRSLRTVAAGSGDPLVVFEAGLGDCASIWVTVQRLVAEQTRTLAYDRAGFGGSDDDPNPRSLERMVADLAAVLDRIDATGVVLVGTSLGGPILRLFALTRPQQVAGLVFADTPVAEAMPDWFARRITTSLAILAALSRVGLHTALARAAMKPATDVPMPPADRTVLVRDFFSARNVRMAARETREIRLSASTLTDLQSPGLPDVPVTTLVGEQTDPSIPAKLRAVMLDVSRSEMRTHPHGRFVAATHSSHFIAQQEPKLLAGEILATVRTVRADHPEH